VRVTTPTQTPTTEPVAVSVSMIVEWVTGMYIHADAGDLKTAIITALTGTIPYASVGDPVLYDEEVLVGLGAALRFARA
jgi:hypothetical protein